MAEKCLCHVRGDFEIVYCPLHEAAPELWRIATKALTLKWLRNLCLNHRKDCAAITLYDNQCSCGLKDYLAIDDELRAALNPSQAKKDK